MNTVSLLTVPAPRERLSASGAELVGLAEHLYRRAFAGAVLFTGVAATAALALLPLRDSASAVNSFTPTVLLTFALAVAALPAARRSQPLYRRLRRDPRLEAIPVLLSAALITYPLRSELWWPACALLMVVAVVAPLARTLAYAAVVVAVNLAAHSVAGDLDSTPAVAIIGLWIGFGFWPTMVAVFSDRIAAYLLRLDAADADGPGPAAVPMPPEDEPGDAVVGDPPLLPAPPPAERLERLTARQLEVTALLADGLRYQEVADCLSISTRQVQRHVALAVRRLDVRNANELIAVAVATGLVPASTWTGREHGT
jgi:DNA-binding CsgD family transcriptional regulator